MVARLHDLFPHPEDLDVKIWRYMDLSKFLALLQDGRLYFSRLDQLGDPFEGSISKPSVETLADNAFGHGNGLRYLNPDFYPDFVRPYWPIHLQFSEWTPEYQQEFISGLGRIRSGEHSVTYVSCWHMNVGESAAMWRLYSQSSDAVCIRATYRNLYNMLPDCIFMGKVSYVDYDTQYIPLDNILAPMMMKRRSFEHEREIRALYYRNFETHLGDKAVGVLEDNGAKFSVDLNSLIESVYISPTSPGWFKAVVEKAKEKYGLKALVHQSEISQSPIY